MSPSPSLAGAAGADRLPLEFRTPEISDAARMWRIVEDTPELDTNSPYAYLLLCSHFASTSLVADERGAGDLAGCVASYRLPDEPDVLFVWQVAVNRAWRRRGLGLRMLMRLLDQAGNRGVRHVHATITPSNLASGRLFRSFAAAVGAPCATAEEYQPNLFPDARHEAEVAFRVGPIPMTPIPMTRSVLSQ
jgi:L-2,4-diaminobutyric acid acetyltransferase